MKKSLAKISLVTLSIFLTLLLVTACGSSDTSDPAPENPPVESPAPTPDPEPTEPLPTEDNGLGVNLYDLVNSCPSESLNYEGTLTNCNLDNLVMFTIVGEINNPEKFGVLFYASAYNDYQNEQVAEVLNALNARFFTDSISVTQGIILEATQSVLNNGERRYLYIDGYKVEIYGSPAQDGGGSVASYFITK